MSRKVVGKEMVTIAEAFPKTFSNRVKLGLIGIEIETEVESENSYPKNLLEKHVDDHTGEYWWTIEGSQYWKGVHDGSLRNYGVEFILKEPLDYSEAMTALDEFESAFKDVPFLEDQPGTSVHVHLNFQHRTLVELASFVTTFSLVENLLAEFSGVTRRSNLFARPHRVAEAQLVQNIKLFERVLTGHHASIMLDEGQSKYACMNLASLWKLGTVEIRCFRGTTDVSEIKKWITILKSVYDFSTRLDSPKELVKMYRQIGPDLAKVILGRTFPFSSISDFEALVRRNEYYMVRYANSIDDWSTFGSAYKKESRTKSPKSILVDPSVLEMAGNTYTIQGDWGAVGSILTQTQPAYQLTGVQIIDDFESESEF